MRDLLLDGYGARGKKKEIGEELELN